MNYVFHLVHCKMHQSKIVISDGNQEKGYADSCILCIS